MKFALNNLELNKQKGVRVEGIRKGIVVYTVFFFLIVPTSAFATEFNNNYSDDKKINKKDWERYFKKKKYPPKCEKESRDIWRKWFCYDDWKDDCEVDDDSDGDES